MALEAVVGDHNSLNGRLEAAQADAEVFHLSFFKCGILYLRLILSVFHGLGL